MSMAATIAPPDGCRLHGPDARALHNVPKEGATAAQVR